MPTTHPPRAHRLWPSPANATAAAIIAPWRHASLGVAFSLLATLPTEASEETQALTENEANVIPGPRFNSSFLFGGAHSGDLQAFLAGSNVLPGVYRLDVLVNRELVGRQDIAFISPGAGQAAVPCINLRLLEHAGIDLAPLEARGLIDLKQADQCLDLLKLIEYSTIEYDANRLRLSITVPQASMKRGTRGYVNPDLWDEGLTAGFVNYNFSARGNQSQGRNNDNLYLGMTNGVNLGMWRFRNDSNISQSTNSRRQFTRNRTFAERDITPLRSQLSVGETYDNTQIFDSFRFRGIALRSDEAMLPDGERGYAPVIRGTAESNATVEIRQNGYLLLSTNVSPGPFVISDISPSGSNGDLEITVIEADGRRHVSTQAFASLPRMVREGGSRYTLAAGQYGVLGQGTPTPRIVTGSLTYGVTAETTIYGGLQWSERYRAGNLGMTRNTPIGAISADMTQSLSAVQGNKEKGQSMRLLYAKTLTQTDTTLTLASYRYSTEGYRTLSDHVQDLASPLDRSLGRARSRFDLTINQNLGRKDGSLYLTSSQQRYWNLPGQSQQLQAGYSNHWRNLNYNINLMHTRTPASSTIKRDVLEDTSLNFTLSLPLGNADSTSRASFSGTLRDRGYTAQSGLNGRLMDDPNSHYSLRLGTEKNQGETASASLNTRTPVANLSAGYSAGPGYSSTNVGASGSLVAHAGGINFGQSVGDTFALAHVDGVEGAKLATSTGVTTGFNGYAIVPHVTPYRNNWVRLDTRDIGAGVEIDNPSQQLIPRRGSITKASFAAQQGRRVQFDLRREDGSPMPFGAVLLDAEKQERGITDPFGKALAMVEHDRGVITVKTASGTCEFEYQLAERAPEVSYERVAGVCL